MQGMGTRRQDPDHFQGPQGKEHLVDGCGQAACPSSKFHPQSVCVSDQISLFRQLEEVTAAFECIV